MSSIFSADVMITLRDSAEIYYTGRLGDRKPEICFVKKMCGGSINQIKFV